MLFLVLFSFFREDGRGAGASCERNKGITTASCFVSPLPLSSSCSLLFSSISHILRAPFTLPSLFIQPLSPPFASSSFFQSSVPLLLQVSPSSTPVYLPQDFFFLFFWCTDFFNKGHTLDNLFDFPPTFWCKSKGKNLWIEIKSFQGSYSITVFFIFL